MVKIDLNIHVNESNPDDFYLQWPEIFWWQMKFNLDSAVKEAMNYINKGGIYQ